MCEGVWSGEEGMTRALIHTLDAIGEYTIAEDNGDSVTIIGQVEEESDARLFCAAPELLEALQEMLEAYGDDDPENNSTIKTARAAITKALGETK